MLDPPALRAQFCCGVPKSANASQSRLAPRPSMPSNSQSLVQVTTVVLLASLHTVPVTLLPCGVNQSSGPFMLVSAHAMLKLDVPQLLARLPASYRFQVTLVGLPS